MGNRANMSEFNKIGNMRLHKGETELCRKHTEDHRKKWLIFGV